MDIINDAIQMLLGAGSEVLTVILILALGYAVRLMPFLPNRIIPPIIILFGITVYCSLKNTGDVPPTVPNPTMWKAVIGLIISVFVWTFHYTIIRRLESKLPPKIQEFLNSASGDSDSKPTNPEQKTP